MNARESSATNSKHRSCDSNVVQEDEPKRGEQGGHLPGVLSSSPRAQDPSQRRRTWPHHQHDLGPGLKNDIPSGKQRLSPKDENVNMCHLFFSDNVWVTEKTSKAYF